MAKSGPKPRPVAERFWAKVDRSGGPDACWPFQASVNAKGYGQFDRQLAHRVAYTLTFGPPPSGLDVDHVCHNESDCRGGVTCLHRRCCNPAHLRAVAHGLNLRDGRRPPGSEILAALQRAKTHCPRGHPYDEENTYVLPSRPSARYCRQCHLERTRERRARAKKEVMPSCVSI